MTTLKSSPKLPTTLSWYLSTTFFLWYLLLCLSQSPKISKKILLNLLIKRTDMSHKNLNWNTKMADMSTLPMLAIKRIDCQTSTMETQNLRIVYHFLLKRITIFWYKIKNILHILDYIRGTNWKWQQGYGRRLCTLVWITFMNDYIIHYIRSMCNIKPGAYNWYNIAAFLIHIPNKTPQNICIICLLKKEYRSTL